MQSTLFIHNTTRNPATRHIRRGIHGPESSTKNLFIGGQLRVIRGRPSPVTETWVRQHRQELADKEAKGLLAVYTADSKRMNLESLEVIVGAPPPMVEADDVEPTAESVPAIVEAPEPLSLEIPSIEAAATESALEDVEKDNPFFGKRRKR